MVAESCAAHETDTEPLATNKKNIKLGTMATLPGIDPSGLTPATLTTPATQAGLPLGLHPFSLCLFFLLLLKCDSYSIKKEKKADPPYSYNSQI